MRAAEPFNIAILAVPHHPCLNCDIPIFIRSTPPNPPSCLGRFSHLVYGQNAQNIGPTDVVTAGEASDLSPFQ